ncbi:S8 family serine peptidase [Mycoplasma sp. 744]|uniref:S8 family serine peptidase n=1 Tax=Mycoplasma sp. 744 TaxID=3108531 RepID=UPI002B1D5168|nr:S8 family serine peptidase [Mycoplasma sp. 744]MEA4115452.1 S8 family serine peptidase [Mycoplasma sp. 744]
MKIKNIFNKFGKLTYLAIPIIPFSVVISSYGSHHTRGRDTLKHINGYGITRLVKIEELSFENNQLVIRNVDNVKSAKIAMVKLKNKLNNNDNYKNIENTNNKVINKWKNQYSNLKLNFESFLTDYRIWIISRDIFSKEEVAFLNKITRDNDVEYVSVMTNKNYEKYYEPNFLRSVAYQKQSIAYMKINEEGTKKQLEAINVYNHLKSESFKKEINIKTNINQKRFKVGIIEHDAWLDRHHNVFYENKIEQLEQNERINHPEFYNYNFYNIPSIHAMNVATILASRYGIAPGSDIFVAPIYNIKQNIYTDNNCLNKTKYNKESYLSQNIINLDFYYKVWIKSIDYLISKGVKVINHSYSRPDNNIVSEYINETTIKYNVLHVFASGNQGRINGKTQNWKLDQNSIVVGSAKLGRHSKWSLSDFSTYMTQDNIKNPLNPLIVAPGEDYDLFDGKQYGTSFSAPVISGLYSLFIRHPEILKFKDSQLPELFKSILVTGASQINNTGIKKYKVNGLEERTGAGMPDYEKMLEIINNEQYEVFNNLRLNHSQIVKGKNKIKLKFLDKIKISLAYKDIPAIKNKTLKENKDKKITFALVLKRITKSGQIEIVKRIYDMFSNVLVLEHNNFKEDSEFFYELETISQDNNYINNPNQTIAISYLINHY